jgi:hypothetical protein
VVYWLACSSWVRSRSDQTNEYKIGICCSPLITQHQGESANTCWFVIRIMCPSGATLYIRGPFLFQSASTTNDTIECVRLAQSSHHYHVLACNLISPWCSWKIVHVALNNNDHSFTNGAVFILIRFYWFFDNIFKIS